MAVESSVEHGLDESVERTHLVKNQTRKAGHSRGTLNVKAVRSASAGADAGVSFARSRDVYTDGRLLPRAFLMIAEGSRYVKTRGGR